MTSGTGAGHFAKAALNRLFNASNLSRLRFHCLQTCFHQLLHQGYRYLFIHWEADNGLCRSIACKVSLMLFYHWRTEVKAHIRFPKTEPGKHSMVIIPFIGLSGYLEVADRLNGARCDLAYRSPDFLQLALHFLRAFCHIFIYAPRLNGSRLGFSH